MKNLQILFICLAALTLGACGGRSVGSTNRDAPARLAGRSASDAALQTDVERLRAATARYHELDSVVAAGYPREAPHCFRDSQLGVMGYHLVNEKLLDDKLDLEHPEILLYSHGPNGEYRLNGVEFIVPYSVHSRDAAPPTIMGQQLKRSDELKLWYLHAWVWTTNPSGMFADYNPAITC